MIYSKRLKETEMWPYVDKTSKHRLFVGFGLDLLLNVTSVTTHIIYPSLLAIYTSLKFW